MALGRRMTLNTDGTAVEDLGFVGGYDEADDLGDGLIDNIKSIVSTVKTADFSKVGGNVADLAAGSIEEIRFESEWLPIVSITQAEIADARAPGPPNWFLALVKPKITVKAAGATFARAPWGEPGESKWPFVALGLGVLTAFAIVGAVTTVKYVRDRRRAKAA